jgi:flagellar FliJ protein
MAVDLDRQIAIEQERAGISDVNHYAYPTFAKAAIQRRNNLTASAADLEARLAAARGELDEACGELKKIELLEERDVERLRVEQARTPTQPEQVGSSALRAKRNIGAWPAGQLTRS